MLVIETEEEGTVTNWLSTKFFCHKINHSINENSLDKVQIASSTVTLLQIPNGVTTKGIDCEALVSAIHYPC